MEEPPTPSRSRMVLLYSNTVRRRSGVGPAESSGEIGVVLPGGSGSWPGGLAPGPLPAPGCPALSPPMPSATWPVQPAPRTATAKRKGESLSDRIMFGTSSRPRIPGHSPCNAIQLHDAVNARRSSEVVHCPNCPRTVHLVSRSAQPAPCRGDCVPRRRLQKNEKGRDPPTTARRVAPGVTLCSTRPLEGEHEPRGGGPGLVRQLPAVRLGDRLGEII